MEVKVVIPSHKRADRVKTAEVVSNVSICVPESQVAAYTKSNPGVEIIAHPDTIIGLAPKRQWIYEKFEDVFMLDDDIRSVQRMYVDRDDENFIEDPDEVYDIIQNLAFLAREMGCYLCGFGNIVRPVFYDEFKPLSLSGVVNGSNFGIFKGSKLWFNPESVAVEDYWISGLNAYYHRKCLIDNRFHFNQTDTFHNKGGQADYRTLDTEKQDTEFLRRNFGSIITNKKDGQVSRTHRHQRGMRLPF